MFFFKVCWQILNQFKIINWFKKWYLLLIIFLVYLPLIIIFILSFSAPSVKGNVTPDLTNLKWNFGKNFHDLWNQQSYYNNFWISLRNSLFIAFIVSPFSVFIGLITAIGLWRSKQIIKNVSLGLNKIIIINPDPITGIALLILFVTTLMSWGYPLGFFSIIIAHSTFTIPYMVVTIYPRVCKLNYNLILAGYDLKHNSFSVLTKIILPQIKGTLMSALAMAFILSFDDFIITNLIKGKVQTISTELYTMSKGIKSWVVVFGALLLITQITIVLIWSCVKLIAQNNNLQIKLKYFLKHYKREIIKYKEYWEENVPFQWKYYKYSKQFAKLHPKGK